MNEIGNANEASERESEPRIVDVLLMSSLSSWIGISTVALYQARTDVRGPFLVRYMEIRPFCKCSNSFGLHLFDRRSSSRHHKPESAKIGADLSLSITRSRSGTLARIQNRDNCFRV